VNTRNALAAIAGLVGASAAAGQSEFVVTFDGPNEGGWTFFGPEVINNAGGNPGAWLHSTCQGLECLDAPFVILQTAPRSQSAFTGDYRGARIDSLGFDAILLHVSITARERPMSLALVNYNGTPEDPIDDVWVYTTGDEIPQPGDGWESFDFDVPAAATSLPSGWSVWFESPIQGDAAWNHVIVAVDEVRFFWAHPESFAILQQWEPGADNIRIGTDAVCYPDCDTGTGLGVLDIFDFLCFQNRFAIGASYACDCDTSTGQGVCDIFDFLCFQNAFSAGCP
jgi:hypothetical protein